MVGAAVEAVLGAPAPGPGRRHGRSARRSAVALALPGARWTGSVGRIRRRPGRGDVRSRPTRHGVLVPGPGSHRHLAVSRRGWYRRILSIRKAYPPSAASLLQRSESFLREWRFFRLREMVEEILQSRLGQRGLLELGQRERFLVEGRRHLAAPREIQQHAPE